MAIDPKTGIDREAIAKINAANPKGVGYERVPFVISPVGKQDSSIPPKGVRGYNPDGSYQYAPGVTPPVNPPKPTSTQLFGGRSSNKFATTQNDKATTPQFINQFMSGAKQQQDGTKDNAAVLQGGTYTGTLPQAQEGGLPAPTVATPQKPVIMRTKGSEKVGYQPTDYSDVEAMDLVQLRDFSRSLQYDQSQGKTLTKEQMLKLQRAQDRAIELSAPQSQVTTTALDTLVSDKEKAKSEAQTQLEAQNQAQLQSQQQFEQQRLAAIQAQNAKAEEKQRNTLGYILGAQGAATSSYGAEALNEITGYFNQQNQLAIAESYANLEKFKAEQAGATREQLQKYDDQIFQLQAAKAKYVTEAAMKVDEYNQQQAQGTEKSLQNILDVAMAQEAAQIPLTDAEKEQVKAYGQLLIDEKGGINKEMLDIVPPKLRNQALINAAAVKGALPKEPKTLNTDGGAFVYDYATQTWKKLAGSEGEKDDKRTQLDDGTLLNTRTGATRNVTSEGTIQSAIQKAVEKVGDAAQCGRFVNEVGKQAGVNLGIGNSYASKEAAINKIGQAMNANEMGAGSIFAYPTGTEYGHIGIVTSVNDDGTINIMDYNYNEDEKRRERMNVNPSEILGKGGLISKPIITNETAGKKDEMMMEAQGLIQGLGGTEKERATIASNIVKKAQQDGISLQEAKKALKYKTGDDIEFAKTRKTVVEGITKNDDSIRKARQALALLKNPQTPIGDVATIVAFLKTIDPSSVARETEVASVENAVSLIGGLEQQWLKASSGKKLTPEQRADLENVVGTIVKAYDSNLADTISSMKQEFDDRGLDMSVYVQKKLIDKYGNPQTQTAETANNKDTNSDPLGLFQ